MGMHSIDESPLYSPSLALCSSPLSTHLMDGLLMREGTDSIWYGNTVRLAAGMGMCKAGTTVSSRLASIACIRGKKEDVG